MEYLEGDTLAQRLERGALPLDQALKVAIETPRPVPQERLTQPVPPFGPPDVCLGAWNHA